MMQPVVAGNYEPLQLWHAENLNIVLNILDDPERHQVHAKQYV